VPTHSEMIGTSFSITGSTLTTGGGGGTTADVSRQPVAKVASRRISTAPRQPIIPGAPSIPCGFGRYRSVDNVSHDYWLSSSASIPIRTCSPTSFASWSWSGSSVVPRVDPDAHVLGTVDDLGAGGFHACGDPDGAPGDPQEAR